MNQDKWYLTTSRLALVAAFAAGLAASPFAIGDGTVAPKAALAQTDGGDDNAGDTSDGANDDADGAGDGAAAAGGGAGGTDDDGAAEEFVQDPTSDVGGSGELGVSTGEKRQDIATLNKNTPEFQEYKSAAERNDLDAAARALSNTQLSEGEITPEMVEQVNEDLEVRTTLTAEQIADAVRRDQPY